MGPFGTMRKALSFAIAQQTIILVLSALLLDGGGVLHRVTVAMVAFWCFVLIVLVRRRTQPMSGDILFIKYGIWLLMPIAGLVANLLGRY